jgi:hypothetical protein
VAHLGGDAQNAPPRGCYRNTGKKGDIQVYFTHPFLPRLAFSVAVFWVEAMPRCPSGPLTIVAIANRDRAATGIGGDYRTSSGAAKKKLIKINLNVPNGINLKADGPESENLGETGAFPALLV